MTLSADRLRELLDYNPLTGVFLWKVSLGQRARAGKVAGYVWTDPKSGIQYRKIGMDGVQYPAHRLAALWMIGSWPSAGVDHNDRNGLNNAWCNLRPANQSQNIANTKCFSNNQIGLKGVRKHKSCNRFEARIRIGGRPTYLGLFDTPEEAHAAYVSAAEEHFGEFMRAA